MYPGNRKSSKREVRQIDISSPNSDRTQTLDVFSLCRCWLVFCLLYSFVVSFLVLIRTSRIYTVYVLFLKPYTTWTVKKVSCSWSPMRHLVVRVSKPTWDLPRVLCCLKNLERRKAKTPPRAFGWCWLLALWVRTLRRYHGSGLFCKGIFRQQNQEVLYCTFPTDINDDSSGYREVSFGKGKKRERF